MPGANVLTASNAKQSKLLPSKRFVACNTPPVRSLKSTPTKLLTEPVLPPILYAVSISTVTSLSERYIWGHSVFVPQTLWMLEKHLDQIHIELNYHVVDRGTIPVFWDSFMAHLVCHVATLSLNSVEVLQYVLGCVTSLCVLFGCIFFDLLIFPSRCSEE